MDLSFVRAMNEHADCHYLCDIYPKLYKATALDLSDAPQKADIYPMGDIEGMKCFSTVVPMDQCHVINRTSNHPFHPSNLLLQISLLSFICNLNPDIIHFNNLVYFNHFYLFLFRSRLIISIHDPFPHSGEEGETMTMSARVYRYLNRTLVHTHLLYNDSMTQAYASSRNISPSRIITSRLGPYDYLRSARSGEVASPCDFLFFGRIQRYKGIDLLLEAFQLVIREVPNARLIIAGSGKFWFDPASYQIPDENLLILNRFIPASELADLIDASTTVVCPYRDATQSGVVMSAYAFCKPVVVTDVGALREVVEHGRTGLVVPPDDAGALADALVTCLKSCEMIANFRENIDEIFYQGKGSWRSITAELLEKYADSRH